MASAAALAPPLDIASNAAGTAASLNACCVVKLLSCYVVVLLCCYVVTRDLECTYIYIMY